uniref:Uncharacterized protein n=1 Tax=Gasterosteus aculeatus TaxID=69293 RepID=G3N9R1_GASAC
IEHHHLPLHHRHHHHPPHYSHHSQYPHHLHHHHHPPYHHHYHHHHLHHQHLCAGRQEAVNMQLSRADRQEDRRITEETDRQTEVGQTERTPKGGREVDSWAGSQVGEQTGGRQAETGR